MSEGQHLADTVVAFFAYANHGTLTPFTDAVAGLTAVQAATDPGHGLHSVWATVSHVRFWHEVTLRQLRGLPVDYGAVGPPNDWPPPADPPDEEAWRGEVDRTVALNQEVAQIVEGLGDQELEEAVVAGYVTRWQIVQSLIAHNAYHTCGIIAARRVLGLWAPKGC